MNIVFKQNATIDGSIINSAVREIHFNDGEMKAEIEEGCNIIPWVVSYDVLGEDSEWTLEIETEGYERDTLSYRDICYGLSGYIMGHYQGCCPTCTSESGMEKTANGEIFHFDDLCGVEIVLQLALFGRIIYG